MTSPCPMLRAIAVAALCTSTLSTGCYRTVLVPTSELPRLVAAQSEGAPELDVVDLEGQRTTLDTPIDEVTLDPVDPSHVFMQAPGQDVVVAVPAVKYDALYDMGWREASLSVHRPFEATVGPQYITLTERSEEGVGPRRVLMSARHVRAVEVKQFSPGATTGATLGIVLGIPAVTFGTLLLAYAIAGGGCLGC
jgi:hypothetical protein